MVFLDQFTTLQGRQCMVSVANVHGVPQADFKTHKDFLQFEIGFLKFLLQKIVFLGEYTTIWGHSCGVLKLWVLSERLDNAW